ncbi:hypothetical protein E1176_17695 [Fulvivirga sp. RKSG066]|uniref:hypothetical protein n=1 Tax=Fulvivirga aurantia TaxID=2529383 RepID=UPI0012BC1178|nr:hypothetical protein [Fulvivirga aurantia]MTI22870.1 hypothetical protein [Fulvivirga aurantia]
MKQPIYYLRLMKYISISLTLVFAVSAMVSCIDDDPGIDPDAPVIQAAEGSSVRGGETLEVTFTVIAPGTVSEVTVAASAGTATIINTDDIVGTTNAEATVSYETAADISGTQTVTLTVTDQQGKSTNQAVEVEVFAPVNYGMALVSGAGDVTTTFLQGLIDLDLNTIDNSSSTELAQFAAVYSDGNALFTAGFGAPATMGKYVFNSAGEAKLDQEIIVPGSSSFSSVEIIDENKGYATVGGGLSRAVQFSPSEMRITGEIDLSSAGEGLFYSDMIVRGNTLFIALNDFGGSGEAMVAVVDLQTNTLEKVITDTRTSTLFGSLTTAIMTEADNGDIYVQGSGLFSDKPSGILRIKAGETEFDTGYFFDLTATVGGSCFGLYHFGDGLTFTAVSSNDDNWFGFDGDNPAFRYHQIDLAAKTDGGDLAASLPNTFAASRTMFFFQSSDDEILFPIAGKDEDAIYSYAIGSGEVSKKITSSSGYVSGLVQVN